MGGGSGGNVNDGGMGSSRGSFAPPLLAPCSATRSLTGARGLGTHAIGDQRGPGGQGSFSQIGELCPALPGHQRADLEQVFSFLASVSPSVKYR